MEQSFFVLAGAFIGGLFTYLSAYRGSYVSGLERELRRIKSKHLAACQQIKAYYYLEARYVTEISKLTEQTEQTVKIKNRDDVEMAGYPRPNWTARDADNAIAELDG